MEIYKKLCQLTQDNLQQYDRKAKFHFEQAEGLSDSIFSYPQSKLLNIASTETFVRECFYKILDRPVDDAALKNFTRALKSNRISKQELIETLSSSSERAEKHTELTYE